MSCKFPLNRIHNSLLVSSFYLIFIHNYKLNSHPRQTWREMRKTFEEFQELQLRGVLWAEGVDSTEEQSAVRMHTGTVSDCPLAALWASS